MVEWLEELVYSLSGGKWFDYVIPLGLTRRVFVVYQQLTKDKKFDAVQIKEALVTAFVTHKFIAYDQFETCILLPGETINVYLADLQKKSVLFGGIPDSVMACIFV